MTAKISKQDEQVTNTLKLNFLFACFKMKTVIIAPIQYFPAEYPADTITYGSLNTFNSAVNNEKETK